MQSANTADTADGSSSSNNNETAASRPLPVVAPAVNSTGASYNTRNPAVRRLLHEARELQNATDQFWARPLEDNLFEWHFTIAGPSACEFEGGLYHGRIIMPADYPLKPPSFILLTPNGRFETNRKICLSISGHHPETWQPSWSIRTALVALIAFLPTPSAGAIGSLEYPAEERKKLAAKSRSFSCPDCGCVSGHLLKPVNQASPSTDSATPSSSADKSSASEAKVTEGNSTNSSTASEKDVPPVEAQPTVSASADATRPQFPFNFPSFASAPFSLPASSSGTSANSSMPMPMPMPMAMPMNMPPPVVAAAYLPWLYQSVFNYATYYAHQAAIAAVVAGASQQRVAATFGIHQHLPDSPAAAPPPVQRNHHHNLNAGDIVALQQHRERRASAYLFAIILIAWTLTRFIDRFFLI